MVKIEKRIIGLDGKERRLIIDSDTKTIFYSGISSDFKINPEVKKTILEFEDETKEKS